MNDFTKFVMAVLSGIFFLSKTTASLDDGSKIEATEGENVTLFFPLEDVGKAGRLRITFEAEDKNTILVAQRCFHPESCADVEKPGVSMRRKGGNLTLTLQHVNKIRDSGVYEAQIFVGKMVYETSVTLVVNESPPVTTSLPGPISSPKPPEPQERQRLYVLISPVILTVTVLCPLIIKYTMQDDSKRSKRQMGPEKDLELELEPRSCDAQPDHVSSRQPLAHRG